MAVVLELNSGKAVPAEESWNCEARVPDGSLSNKKTGACGGN